MPIYEYQCLKCGKHVEALQKVSDKPLAKCGECGGKLEKQWSQTGVQFKGSGWYVTDYAGRKGGDTKSDDAKSDDAKSGDGKTGDSKPDAPKAEADKSKGDTAKKAGKGEGASTAKPAANAKG